MNEKAPFRSIASERGSFFGAGSAESIRAVSKRFYPQMQTICSDTP